MFAVYNKQQIELGPSLSQSLILTLLAIAMLLGQRSTVKVTR